MGSFSDSLQITRTALRLIRQNRTLLALPALGGLVLLGLLLALLVGLYLVSGAQGASGFVLGSPLGYGAVAVLLVGYFALVFIASFFSAALVGVATQAMDGRRPTVRDGLRFAAERWQRILLWSLVAGTVGLLIRVIASRLRGIEGLLVTVVAGTTWAIATYFMIPVLCFERQTFAGSLRRSASLFARNFGRTFYTNAIVVILAIVLGLVGGALVIAGFVVGFTGGSLGLALALAAAGLVVWVVAAVLVTTLEGVVRAALYRYATTGQVPFGLVPMHYRQTVPPPPPPAPEAPPSFPPPLPSGPRL